MKKLLLLGLLIPHLLLAYVRSDIVSINGIVTFDGETIRGNFTYLLQNNSSHPQKQWTFIVSPNVDILSLSQLEENAQLNIIKSGQYNILEISLPTPISPDSRSPLNITFSISQQNRDPRFFVTEESVFLDARKLWFPFPNNDSKVNFNITVRNHESLSAIIGGKKISERIVLQEKISTWENDLKDLSPSLSLLIQKQNAQKIEDFYFYGNNEKNKIISDHLIKYWKHLQTQHKDFPINEIHILSQTNITLPNYYGQTIDGEFIGNIFLINQEIFNDPQGINKITETLIHEIYHSYFPGVIKFNKEDLLYFESLIQHFTWNLLNTLSPSISQSMNNRDFFVFKNTQVQNNPDVWNFLFYNILLNGTFYYNDISSIKFLDILSEKYADVEMNKKDFYDTFIQEIQLKNSNSNPLYFQQLSPNFKKQDFNTSLNVIQSNFSIHLSNQEISKEIPITLNFFKIENNFPFQWSGELIIQQKPEAPATKFKITIPPHGKWETNIIGLMQIAYTKSLFDPLETQLRDNYYNRSSEVDQIIDKLNAGLKNNIINSDDPDLIKEWSEQDRNIIWDQYQYLDPETIRFGAYLNNTNQNPQYIKFTINTSNQQELTIHDIISP